MLVHALLHSLPQLIMPRGPASVHDPGHFKDLPADEPRPRAFFLERPRDTYYFAVHDNQQMTRSFPHSRHYLLFPDRFAERIVDSSLSPVACDGCARKFSRGSLVALKFPHRMHFHSRLNLSPRVGSNLSTSLRISTTDVPYLLSIFVAR